MKSEKLLCNPLLLLLIALFLVGCSAREEIGPGTSASVGGTSENAETPRREGENETMQEIEIQVGDTVYTASLYENQTAQAFAELLPLQLDMQELNGNEKYFYLQDSLPGNAELVSSIRTGDLMLFGSDCIVLFYQDFSTPYRYTRIGFIQDPEGLSQTLGKGNVAVTFRLS